MSIRFIKLLELKERTTLSRSSIYNKIRDDDSFPQPIKLGERSVAFVEAEVDEWIKQKIAESRPQLAEVLS